jgi:hypothetical protein
LDADYPSKGGPFCTPNHSHYIGMLDGIRSKRWAPSPRNAWTVSVRTRTAGMTLQAHALMNHFVIVTSTQTADCIVYDIDGKEALYEKCDDV